MSLKSGNESTFKYDIYTAEFGLLSKMLHSIMRKCIKFHEKCSKNIKIQYFASKMLQRSSKMHHSASKKQQDHQKCCKIMTKATKFIKNTSFCIRNALFFAMPVYHQPTPNLCPDFVPALIHTAFCSIWLAENWFLHRLIVNVNLHQSAYINT